VFDEIEESLLNETKEGPERQELRDRLIQAKLKRAGKIAKALSKE